MHDFEFKFSIGPIQVTKCHVKFSHLHAISMNRMFQIWISKKTRACKSDLGFNEQKTLKRILQIKGSLQFMYSDPVRKVGRPKKYYNVLD